MLNSTPCRYEHFETPWYRRWIKRIGSRQLHVDPQAPVAYRKAWEWAAILQALDERDMLARGRDGIGFAVGQEPVTSIIASFGPQVLASDVEGGEVGDSWADTQQHAASRDAIFHGNHVDRTTFERLVRFEPVDMNNLAGLPTEGFDFAWSSCALEHLGSLEAGLAFVVDSTRLLRPGGVAVHTTEYNVSSNDETIGVGRNCVYRRRDLEDLDRRLRRIRCTLEPVDFDAGTHAFDLDYDPEPYFTTGRAHIKLEIGGFVCTSFLLIVRKVG